MLLHRLLTAAVGIPLGLLLIFLGGWYFAAAVALIAFGGLRELYRLLAIRERRAAPWIGYPLALLLLFSVTGANHAPALIAPPLEAALLAAAFAVSAWWLLSTVPGKLVRFSATLTAHIYVPQLLSYLVRLRNLDLASNGLPPGAFMVLLLMAVIWGMDTAAYAVGKTLGRHKLCPSISPGKTIEGAIGAFIAAVALSGVLGYLFELPLVHGLVLGALVGVVGQVGDLFESMLKRRAGVKDSGAILPGHGGVLDRFDSLLLAAPVAYFYLSSVAGR